MPPRSKVVPQPGERVYLCDCAKHCKGRLAILTQRNHSHHAPHRTTSDEILLAYYQSTPNALGTRVPYGASSLAAPSATTGRSSGPRSAASSQAEAAPSHLSGSSTSQPGRMASETARIPHLDEDEEMLDDTGMQHVPMPPRAPSPEPIIQPPVPQASPPLSRDSSPTPPPPGPAPAQPELGEDEDAEEGFTEGLGVPLEGHREDVRIANHYIQRFRRAKLSRSGLDADTLTRMQDPRKELEPLTPLQRAALEVLLARGDASEANYADVRLMLKRLHPEDELPTHDQAKSLLASVTGIHAIRTDMCVNTCMAYTGPYALLRKCPECQEPRYDPWKEVRGRDEPRRTFCTFPLGPQLQALYGSAESARLMRHRATRTKEILTQIATRGEDSIDVVDDIYFAQDYLRLIQNNTIKDDDIVLMFSLDGAQIYQNKKSDTWFFVWVIFDLPPTHRYKKQYVIPGGVIPGPKKPKIIDSFLFPALNHLAALQNDGLSIWDTDRRILFRSYPFLYLATADSPGMAYLNGLVGHQGRQGCRIYCGQEGRHKPGQSTYYPALFKPANSSAHENNDYDPPTTYVPDDEPARYAANLHRVEESRNENDYIRNRLETGIAKPSLIGGLPRAQRIPRGFGLDLMHLISLNLTDLVMSLLRGTLACEDKPADDKTTWKFAIFADKEVWQAHGRLVGEATRYLPSSFDRPPRNPAEKINSGFKAWEFLQYVYGLLPGLLRPLLHSLYYRHFCKLVFAVRILSQRSLPLSQLAIARQCITEYVVDFENIYYVRRIERLHFVRPSLHTLAHIVSEIERTGLCSLYTQWTLENYIGNITREIKQHVTPYANVSERALRRCQANALRSIDPSFAAPVTEPRYAQDLGDGYVLLSPFDSSTHLVAQHEIPAIHAFYNRLQAEVDPAIHPLVTRWGRLHLPTGQIARTAWKEVELESRRKQPRRARMVKLQNTRFAEVQYLFQSTVHGRTHTVAMVSVFSVPDPDILIDSIYTVAACRYLGSDATSYEVVDVKDIVAVVAMVPLPLTTTEAQTPANFANRFFVVEKPGLDIAYLAGKEQDMAEDNDDI